MFDFPNSPTIGQQVIEPNGAAVQWDGTKWASVAGQVSSVAPALNNVGRNLIHNGMFNVAQRGVGPWTTSGVYTSDRWQMIASGDTASFQVMSLIDSDRTAIGDEAATYCFRNVFTGTAGANFTAVQQPIENIRRLAGKTVTVSFWSCALSGTPKLGVNIVQWFGSGGSPSAVVQVAGQAVTLSTAWQRFSLTFSIPSIVGKTLGSNGDDATNLRFWYSAGSTNSANSGNIGVQSGTIWLWGIQLEIGSTMTPLEKLDPRIDLANCQRFYQAGIGTHAIISAAVASTYLAASVNLAVRMRATPTVATQSQITAPTNCTAPSADTIDPGGFRALSLSTASGIAAFDTWFTASADL